MRDPNTLGMEFFSAASALSSIVGHAIDFKRGQDAKTAQSLTQYLEWLRRQDHEQLVHLIEQDTRVSESVSNLLSQRLDDLVQQIESLEAQMALAVRQHGSFVPLANALAHHSSMPAQGLSILAQMNQAGASKFMVLKTFSGTNYSMIDGDGGDLQVTDQRFIEDDLETLCRAGLLVRRLTEGGSVVFRITRAGAASGQAPDRA